MDSASKEQSLIVAITQELSNLRQELGVERGRVDSLSEGQGTLLSQISAINKALEVSVKAITLLNEVKKVEVPKVPKSWLANLLNLRKK